MDKRTAIETIAASKAVAAATAKAARAEITAGTYEVDFVVHITGEIKVSEDYTTHLVQKADPWTIIANLMNKVNGVTLDSVIEAATGEKLDTKTMKANVAEAMAKVKAPTKSTAKGPVNTDLTMELI